MTADTTDCIILMTDVAEMRLALGQLPQLPWRAVPDGHEGASTAVGFV